MEEQYRSDRGELAFLTQLGRSYTRWLRRREKEKLVANYILAAGGAGVMIFVGSMMAQSAWTAIQDRTPLTGAYHGVDWRSGQPFSIPIFREIGLSAVFMTGGVLWLWINSYCLKRFSRRL